MTFIESLVWPEEIARNVLLLKSTATQNILPPAYPKIGL